MPMTALVPRRVTNRSRASLRRPLCASLRVELPGAIPRAFDDVAVDAMNRTVPFFASAATTRPLPLTHQTTKPGCPVRGRELRRSVSLGRRPSRSRPMPWGSSFCGAGRHPDEARTPRTLPSAVSVASGFVVAGAGAGGVDSPGDGAGLASAVGCAPAGGGSAAGARAAPYGPPPGSLRLSQVPAVCPPPPPPVGGQEAGP